MSSVTRHHDSSISPEASSGQDRVEVLRRRPLADLHEHPQGGLGPGLLGGRRTRGPSRSRPTRRPSAPSGRGPGRGRRRPGRAGGPSAILARTSGSAPSTAGTSITSARPRTCGRPSSSRTWSGPIAAPASSQDVAGTHDEAMKNTSSGSPSAAAASRSIPATPRTLPISCESEITAVVPLGTISLASSAGVRSVLSRCMWVSISPGMTVRPSSVDRLGRLPVEPADPGDPAVGDDHVGLLDAPGEDVHDPPARQEQVARLPAQRDADPPGDRRACVARRRRLGRGRSGPGRVQ